MSIGKLYTQREVAEILGVSTRTVRDLPIRRVRPTPRTVRYREADLERFIAQRAGERQTKRER